MDFDVLIPYLDLIWLPIGLAIAHKGQHLIMAGFFLFSFAFMRLQIELMKSIDYPNGILGLLDTPMLERSLITYSSIYVFYLVLTAVSAETVKLYFLAYSLSIFFAALFISTLVIVL